MVKPGKSYWSPLGCLALALVLLGLSGCQNAPRYIGGGASSSAASGEGVDWRTVRTEWRDHASFVRVQEYFTGEERTDPYLIHRTNPEEREGYYWLVRLIAEEHPAEENLTLRAEWTVPEDPEIRRSEYALPADHDFWDGREVLLFGLTDGELGEGESPTSWRLSVRNAEGEILGVYRSFLWARIGAEPRGKEEEDL
ncbi:MAG: hypothetical protein JJT75_09975 [Opitutales bacterium]|nr:hypothetical protein [Opitutales bacterium]MCH8540683.1 hypothetical protein [Opitutales bacterium]